jgi:hypothetical protein
MDNSIGYQLMLASAGGIVGTVAMDSIKYFGHKLRLIGGVRMDMLGRWALGMLKGKFIYQDIHEASGFAGEVPAGWAFHYLTGVLVAWGFPVFALSLGLSGSLSLFGGAVVFGLITSVLPWFMVYPAFGKGWFGSRAPKSAKPILTSVVSHTFYGAGIGAVYLVAI